MSHPPAGRSDRDWEATPPAVRVMMVQLIAQVEALSDKTFIKSGTPQPRAHQPGFRCPVRAAERKPPGGQRPMKTA